MADGSTKLKLRDIWAQLALSACVLLVPPLLMVAALTFGSSGQQSAAQQTAGPPTTTVEQPQTPPDASTSFALANSEPHAAVTQQPQVGEPLVAVAGTQNPATNDSTRRDTASLDGKGGVQSAMIDPEAPPSTATPTTGPEHSSAAKRKTARDDPHTAYRTKQQHTRPLSDIFRFLRPSGR